MDYGRRPYTASGPSNAINDRVSCNLNRAESLLDEPDTGFSLGGANFGAGSGNQGIGSGVGRSGNYAGARSNYTGSDICDSDTQSNINQSRPRWGNQ